MVLVNIAFLWEGESGEATQSQLGAAGRGASVMGQDRKLHWEADTEVQHAALSMH